MPRPKGVQKLEDLCLKSVAENVEHIWSTFASLKSTTGPFDWIPEVILVRIIDIVGKKKNFNFSQLKYLLTEHLTFLDLSHKTCRYSPVPIASELAAINKCKALKTLKISNEFYFLTIPRLHQNGFPYFSQLQVLSFSTYNTGDDSLIIIGKYCRSLKVLDVSSSKVTDLGIRALCSANTLTDPGPDDPGQCKSLVKLDIKYTDVTPFGVRLALENLPFLECLSCNSSIQALAQINHQFMEFGMAQPTERFIGLKDLYVDQTVVDDDDDDVFPPYIPGSLAKAVQLCPLVTRVEIVECYDLLDSDLFALMGLKNLRNLCIVNCGNTTFDGGILPVLDSVGATLESFSVDSEVFDISSIAECCPNLRDLRALKFGSEYYDDGQEAPVSYRVPVFQKLERIYLEEEFNVEWVITAEDLLAVLSSPCLVSVELHNCFHLTDELLERVSLLHQFRHLEKLCILESPQITSFGMEVFLDSENPLKEVEIGDCELISEDDVKDWVDMAKENNWEITYA